MLIDKIPFTFGREAIASAENVTLGVVKLPADWASFRVVGAEFAVDTDYTAPSGSATTFNVKVGSDSLFSSVANAAGTGDLTAGVYVSLDEVSNGSETVHANGTQIVIDIDNELAAAVGPTGVRGTVWVTPVNAL